MAGFDPSQPRNEDGEWTVAGNSARKAAGIDKEYSIEDFKEYYFHRSTEEGTKAILKSGYIKPGMDNWSPRPYMGLWFDNSKPFVIFAAPKTSLREFHTTFTTNTASNLERLLLNKLKILIYDPETQKFKDFEEE